MIRPNSKTAAKLAAELEEGRRGTLLRNEHLAALAAADALDGKERDRFRQLVGPIHLRSDVGGIGAARIIEDQVTGTYEPSGCDAGTPALIFPVKDIPNGLDAALIDLLAVTLPTRRIYTRLGRVDCAGEWHIRPPIPDALKIYFDPFEWARGNADGVLILQPERARYLLGPFVGHVSFVVEGVSTGQQLRTLLTPPPPPKPQIFIGDAGL